VKITDLFAHHRQEENSWPGLHSISNSLVCDAVCEQLTKLCTKGWANIFIAANGKNPLGK
jgi:hypothetical protein